MLGVDNAETGWALALTFYSVNLYEFFVFFLKRYFSMMLLLIADVRPNLGQL